MPGSRVARTRRVIGCEQAWRITVLRLAYSGCLGLLRRLQVPPASRRNRRGLALPKLDGCSLSQEYTEVSLLHLELPDRYGDFGGRKDRRLHLIEQRLKYVVVAAVDQDK